MTDRDPYIHERQLVGTLLQRPVAVLDCDPRFHASQMLHEQARECFLAIVDCIHRDTDFASRPNLHRVFQASPSWDGQTFEAWQDWAEQLCQLVPVAYHADYHSRAIVEAHQAREIRRLCEAAGRHAASIGTSDGESEKVAVQLISRLQQLVEAGATKNRPTKILDIIQELVSEIERGEIRRTLRTGIMPIDRLLGGLPVGQMSVIAARPGVGKTALAISIQLSVLQRGGRVLFVSLEQPRQEIAKRALVQTGDLPWHSLDTRDGIATDAFIDTANRVSSTRWEIDDAEEHGLKVERLAVNARIRHAAEPLDLIVVDYLQLMEPSDRRVPREQQVSHQSRALARLAKTIGVPVLVLAQLNREADRTGDKPRLSWLRESGAIEQDANQVLFLMRPGADDNSDDPPERAALHVLKNRHGRTGVVPLHFNCEAMRFGEQPTATLEGILS